MGRPVGIVDHQATRKMPRNLNAVLEKFDDMLGHSCKYTWNVTLGGSEFHWGGGVRRGWVGGSSPPPPPRSSAEFLEAEDSKHFWQTN